ncbi:hypothetical protein H2198_010521 [Neophaeococcomyces mojaviensis]|uniref:Uncharacterized protein n=1 Tax=Neophaeococcomyces mojaviensis TaxID=3383035 RepID=A0ACC2ZRA3_9EURO|nr:hypothetical protein H2198_010521 [Knufia sp. JES_112]
MDIEKNQARAETVHVEEEIADTAHLAQREDHDTSKWQSITGNPKAFGWCCFAVLVTLLVSYENQAAGTVLSIPQFRKDFGYFYQGSYVIDAKWQAAFSGAPTAATAVGAIIAGQVADWIGRKYTLMLFMALSYVSITLEFIATSNPTFFAGKLLNGLNVGVLAAVATTYVGEISPLASVAS